MTGRTRYFTSLFYSLKSIRRNFRRSFTLMLGVIISLAIVSGVLFYLDGTSFSMVEAAVEDVDIDVSIMDNSLGETEIRELKNFSLTEIQSELITSAEVFAGFNPFSINAIGAIVSMGEFNLTMQSLRDPEANFSTTYVLAVDPSYFNTFDLLSTSDNVSDIFEQNQVLVSSTLSTELLVQNGDNISLSVVKTSINRALKQLDITTIKDLDLSVGGTLFFDTGIFDDSSSAFKPESSEESTFNLRFFTQTSNCIVMSYSMFMDIFSDASSAISFNGVQVKLDHSKLSYDTTTLLGQLSKITGVIEVFYPNTVVVDLLEQTINSVTDQLNQMRLFLIYFSLPGLLLGGYITKYAIDLTIEERQREIGLLRSRAAQRKQIVLSIALESIFIAFIGLIIGLLAGLTASIAISELLNNGSSIYVSVESSLLSLTIGLVTVLSAVILSITQLLKPSISETVKSGKKTSVAFWKRIYLDFLLVGVVVIIAVLNAFNFNPIPGFATAIYDFLAPLLTWIGLTLLMVRLLEKILIGLKNPISKINSFLFKDLSPIITKNILYRPQRISRIIIVLSLTLSFGMVITIISDTYVKGAYQDAVYQVGSDLRIQFPSKDDLDFNTSDFISELEAQFPNEISSTTAVYTTNIRIGRNSIIIIGVDPDSFFSTAKVNADFFQSGSIENAKSSLLTTDINGTFNTVILSSTIANPSTSTSSQSSRLGGGTQQLSQQIFDIGSSLPLRISTNETITIQVGDIASHFPAIAELTGREESEIRYAICNTELLKEPVPESNVSLLTDENASFMLADINDQYEVESIRSSISDWFDQTFASEATLSFTSTDMMLESHKPFINSLLGLTSLEFLLVLAVSTIGLDIFLTSSLFERKKEFGTYFAIGAPTRDVRRLILGELLLISGFSVITGILLSGLVSFMYIGFLSDLLVLEVSSLSIPFVNIFGLVTLVLIGMIVAMVVSGARLAKLDPVNILRTV
ncbi:MAG: FtsX-like permease family protein [Candidatus Hodarchaeales archaeon]